MLKPKSFFDERLQLNVTAEGIPLIDTGQALGYSICQGGDDDEPQQDD
jgi:hypothetical protein